jgi:hypothetical protein
MPTDFASGDASVSFLVSAGIVYEIIAAACSSPQTTEINAATRAPTLMKWVNIGLMQAAVFIAIAVYLDERRWPPLLGGSLAGVVMYAQYIHARNAGLASAEPATET